MIKTLASRRANPFHEIYDLDDLSIKYRRHPDSGQNYSTVPWSQERVSERVSSAWSARTKQAVRSERKSELTSERLLNNFPMSHWHNHQTNSHRLKHGVVILPFNHSFIVDILWRERHRDVRVRSPTFALFLRVELHGWASYIEEIGNNVKVIRIWKLTNGEFLWLMRWRIKRRVYKILDQIFLEISFLRIEFSWNLKQNQKQISASFYTHVLVTLPKRPKPCKYLCHLLSTLNFWLITDCSETSL